MELDGKSEFKVLHIGNEKSWRGGENQIRLLAEGLKEIGIQSYIAYPQGSRGLEKFQKAFPTLPLSGYRSNMRLVNQLAEYCAEHKIDLVDAHSSGAHSMALSLKKALPQLKLVVHRRVDNPVKRNFFSRRKYMHKNVDAYVAISNKIAEILKEYGIPEEKVNTVRSATSSEAFGWLEHDVCRTKILKQLGLPKDTFLIGNASAFTEQKGYETLVRSIQHLKSRNVSFHCALAGDGELLTEMRNLARTLRVESHITFMGFITNVPEFLTALDVLAVPSNNEGLGTLILDGIHAGCAVAATNVGGIPEMIHHEETGLLCEKGDDETLAQNLQRLIEDSALRDKLIAGAKAHVAANFSLQSMVEGNLKIYRKLLNRD